MRLSVSEKFKVPLISHIPLHNDSGGSRKPLFVGGGDVRNGMCESVDIVVGVFGVSPSCCSVCKWFGRGMLF